MKRPEKKELSNEGNRCVQVGEDYIVGYNQSCDDWEEFLPMETDIKILVSDNCKIVNRGVEVLFIPDFDKIAKAIHKRLTKE